MFILCLSFLLGCKTDVLGREYSGTLANTVSGRQCQHWDSQAPHAHNFTDPAAFYSTSLSSLGNYCRNPDGNSGGPWCITTDPAVPWEYCNIPECGNNKKNECLIYYCISELPCHYTNQLSEKKMYNKLK